MTDDERPAPDARLGRARWDVYANDGRGLSDTPTPFTLPFPLSEVAGAYLGGYVGQNHTVLELTGDGLPDLVVHRGGVSPDEDARLGRAHWLVYRNTGDGFDSTALRWTLPVPLVVDGDDSASAPATQGHTLLRLADPCLSLLFFDDRELPDTDARIGRAYWTYFRSE